MRLRLLPLLLLLSCELMPCRHAACFAAATPVSRLELHAACGERLWAIQATERALLTDVDYGVVPPGFRQIFPTHEKPRPLPKGECIILLWRGDDQFARHHGAAVSPSVVNYGGWQSGPPKGTDDVLFAPGGANEAREQGCPAGPKCGG
jgi:hypothetical protein